MKLNHLKKPISWLLVFAMVLTLCPTVAFAGDTLPYTGESALAGNEPTSHGYRAEDLLSWDPATDPDAELLRARVPLQERIAPVAATQANPTLDPQVEYLTLAGDYGNAFFGGTSYTNEFSEYVFNFWQYIDYYAPWHGQTTAATPFELWDSQGEREGTSNWEKRAFEFGMMNLPNAAYTNAAHKNGVLSLGCIFLPRAYQSWRTLIQRDAEGNFPYADKLVEIAEYYGFDGWFVNLEGSDSPSGQAKTELQAMLAYMREKGQYIQYYNAGGSIDTSFLNSGAADSFFKDYGWSTSGAKNETAQYGYEAVFGGFEAGGARWSGSGQGNYSKLWSNGEIVCSIATLGTDFVHAGIDEDFGNYLELRRETDDFQWMSAVRERMWFTGSSGDPTDSSTHANAEVGVSSNKMPGIASLVTERSVISGDTFYTNFNTGHGLLYAVDGTVSNDHEWANISIQDILPTWQFWFETEGTALKAEYDYGTGYRKGLDASWDKGVLVEGSTTYGEFDFDQVDPYHGGSSLAIYGGMDADNFLHLYKTALDVTEDSNFNITFRKTSADDVAMSLGVVFAKDIDAETDTYTVTEFQLENTTAVGDWTTANVDLSTYAGEQIAMIGLYFRGTAEDYQMHLGRIEYLSGRDLTPAAPENLTIDKAYDSGEMVISWDLGDYDTVKQYNVYAVVGGEELYMGGIYDEIYYIKNIYDMTGEVTIKVTAVGADGSESEAATAVYDYTKAVTGLTVTPADGTLTVGFNPVETAAEITVFVPATGKTYTAAAEAGATGAVVTVPAGAAADGKEYELKITPAGGEAKAYDAELDDSYCIPYDGPMTGHALTSPVACTDWYLMDLSWTTYSGSTGSTQYTRGKKSHGELNNDWSRFQSLPGDILLLEVTLTDYDGNVSEKVVYNFDTDGEPVFPEPFHRVFHLDAGRKYFGVAALKSIIDSLAEANFSQLQLYFSDSQGFRLALDDMIITTEYGTYDLTPALGDGYSDGSKYPDGTGKYLTQAEMEEILAYADEKGIEIVPSVNVPGHMGAILEEFPQLRYNGSKGSIDLTSDEAKAFAKGFVKKYAEYFASKGVKYFNFGADEFANDIGSTMGFEQIYNNGIYAEHFVPFFNDVAAIVKEAGLIPRAFNDGVYYNDDTSFEFDTDVQLCYWASGWGGYNLCDADILEAQGFDLINTSQSYYWVLGNAGWQVSVEKAGQFDYTLFDGGVTVYDPAGAMLCVWCDNGAADGDDEGAGVAQKIHDVLIAFGSTLPEERSSVPILDSTYFPDPAVLSAVMAQVGPYVTDLTGFDGKLDLSNTNAADLTGIAEYLTSLTGLDLTGTDIVRLTSDMLPDSLTELSLTNCDKLVYVELEGHPDLIVDFSGCSAVQNLYLHGTRMTEINITDMLELKNFDISSSQVNTIRAASAAKYQNAYWWNWQAAKLDLSDDTREGKLRAGMESYFAAAELPDEIDTQQSALMNAGNWYSYSGRTKIIDLGSIAKLSSLTFNNSYASWYGSSYSLKNATIYISDDGEAYTEVLAFTDAGTNAAVTITLPEGTSGRYIRLDAPSGTYYTDSWVVYGYAMAPKGFTFDGQQPAMVRDAMEDVIYERNGKQYQLLELLYANYATFRTLAGTPAAELLDQPWCDAAFVQETITAPKGVKVGITDLYGNTYYPSNIAPPELGELDNDTNVGRQATIISQSGQYSNEYSYMLFDGKNNTKWCTGGNTGWAVFQLPEPMVVGRWYTQHAGVLEPESYNTKAFSLQVLDPDVLSEEDFLAMSSSEQNSVMRSNSYWTDLDAVTGNSSTYVDRTIAEDALKEAQVYRLYVGQSVQDTTYGAVRIYELELFAYTGKLNVDANGVFIADQIGTWNVSYLSRGQEIGAFTLNVRLSDEDLVALSEAVEAAQAAAEEAARIAEEAQAKAEEAQARAEEAAASSAEDREAAEAAQREAEEAQAAAEAAQKAAEDSQAAAEAAAEAAAQYNTEAAASAALAAQYAAEVAQAHAEIVAMKAEIIEYLADAQKAAEEAEEAQRKAEEAQKKAEEAALAAAKYYALIELSQIDLEGLNPEQRAAAEEAIAAARAALDTAVDAAEVEAILADAKAAVEEAKSLICASEIFTDVEADAWYHEGVDFVVRKGYMNGVSNELFDLTGNVKRAQLVTILYRIAGEPDVSGLTHSFADVEPGAFYENAVIWAAANGIVNGVSETLFAPNNELPREQIATILYRYNGSPAVEEDHLAVFTDRDSISAYAVDAMNWAVAEGILNGMDQTNLSPGSFANRAQIAVILMRHLTAK